MSLNCQQLITLALQDARKNVPLKTGGGFSSQAGQLFQMILDDLCYKRDLKINITPALVVLTGIPAPPQFRGVTPGVGPYPLPADYLRMAQDEVTYASAGGSPHKMVNTELSEIDLIGLLPTTTNYPEVFATDFSTAPPSLYVWPPPISVINLDIRYFKLQPAIVTLGNHNPPDSSIVVPWFVDQMYLKSRLTGELLKPGAAAKPFLDEADMLLDQYLKLEDDSEGRAIVMKMDERQFPRGRSSKLPRTKGQDF
jgi:hypothetical protein